MRLDRRSSQLTPRRLAPAVVLAVVLAVGSLAGGQEREDVESVRLVFRGHDGCPDEEAFRAGVVARTSRARFVTDEGAARTLDVELTVQVGGTAGRLIVGDGETESRREVSGEDCAIVVDALALVAALAIDPAARLTPRALEVVPLEEVVPSEAGPSGEGVPSEGVPSEVGPSQEGASQEGASIVGPVPAPRWPDDGGADAIGETDPGAWRLLFAGQVHAASGFGRLAPLVGGFGEVGLDRDDWLAPSFRASLFWMPPVEVEVTGGGGSFWRWGGQASACPVGPRPADFVVLRPCLGFELGALKARGVGLDDNEASSTAWASVLAAARTQVFATDWLLDELEAQLGVPLIRPRYLIEPDATVVQVAPLYGGFGSAVGVRLP